MRLKNAFEYVRKIFFPSWDRDGKWIIRLAPEQTAHGYCDAQSNTIFLRRVSEDRQRLIESIIHEVCHATSSPTHGRRWRFCMFKAAAVAETIGEIVLSNLLKVEVSIYTILGKKPEDQMTDQCGSSTLGDQN
ncbi:MAG: hypothetical protein ACP5G0_01270 [Desulfomonilia bacterium]